jgi:hypothetical protein
MAGGDSEEKLASAMVDEGFDSIVSPLSGLSRFTSQTLTTVVGVHEKFVQLARAVTGRTENSFCAKYLSFHHPQAVPIFDHNAYNSSWRLMQDRLPKGLYKDNWNIDYGYHCEAILHLTKALEDAGIRDYDLKQIDYVLYADRGAQQNIA